MCIHALKTSLFPIQALNSYSRNNIVYQRVLYTFDNALLTHINAFCIKGRWVFDFNLLGQELTGIRLINVCSWSCPCFIYIRSKGYHLTAMFEHYYYIAMIMTTMASQITSLTVVYSIVYSGTDQRKHQSSASLAFAWGFHRDRWIPSTKGQLRGKCFHLMTSSCSLAWLRKR